MTRITQGLKELPRDERDFSLGAIYSLPKLDELPAEYVLPQTAPKSQGASDYCTAFATCTASEYQEDASLEPAFSFMLSKIISGDPDEWGQDLRVACASHVKFGALSKKDSPLSLENSSADVLRKIENWPDVQKYLNSAAEQRKKAYVSI